MKKQIIFLLLIGIAAIMATGTVSAATGDTYVNATGGNDLNTGDSWETAYQTIQKGLDTVAEAGTMNIAEGTYTGTGNTNLDVKTSEVTIKGSGEDQTIIDGASYLGSVLRVDSGEKVTIQDLTIQDSINANGALSNSGELIVKNVTFTYNSAYPAINNGGGAIQNTGTLTVIDSYFESNNGLNGGAIYNSAYLTVNDSIFEANNANQGGAIWTDGTLIVTGGNFTGNSANRNGVYIGDGGAIYITGTATITDSTFEKNTATYLGSGGAIELKEGSLSVDNSKFIDNTATFFGGAIDTNHPQTALIITKSLFTGNTAPVAGAVFSLGTLEISESLFDHNTADTLNGGAGAVVAGVGPNSIRYSIFSNNKAAIDGAITMGSTDVVPESGINILGCNFYNNQATISGGAIGVGSGDGGNIGYLNVKYSRFVGNTAGTTPQDIYFHYQSAAAPTINLDAKFNWWGTNTGPESGRIDADEDRIPSSDTYTPWLILSTAANPTSIYPGESSLITADLYTDSDGGNHRTDAASYPDSIPVQFTTKLGTLNNNGQTVDTILNSGTATVTLKSTSSGTAQATTQVDNQATTTTVTIMTPQQSTTNINEAVQDLPATAFGKNADQQKNTFNNMFNAVNNMINAANYKGAIKKLEQIKTSINSLNLDPTSKTELLNMINELIAYLKTLI